MCHPIREILNPAPGAAVFLVDDEPRVRDGLKNLLGAMGWTVSGEAGGSREALAHSGLSGSGLVLLDLALDGESGINLIGPMRERGLRVLVCSLHDGAHTIRRALAAGADGYLSKREVATELRPGLEAVRAGLPFLSPRATAAIALSPQ